MMVKSGAIEIIFKFHEPFKWIISGIWWEAVQYKTEQTCGKLLRYFHKILNVAIDLLLHFEVSDNLEICFGFKTYHLIANMIECLI